MAKQVEPLLDEQTVHDGLHPQAVVGDQSVVDAERRHVLGKRGIEAVGKVSTHRPGERYAKAHLRGDLESGTVTCPGGHITCQRRAIKDKKGRPWQA